MESGRVFYVFLVVLGIICSGVASSAPATVTSEGIVGYESQNSPEGVNIALARDGAIGVWNQAQIKAQACNSDDSSCTSETFAGIYLNSQMDEMESLITISMTYESWGESGPLGEEDPAGYGMYVSIGHKFGTSSYLIESTTTGYDNLNVVEIGDFAPHSNGTITIDVYLYHTDTNSFSDEVSARIHEIWTDKGPTDSDADGVSDASDVCPNTGENDRANVGENGCLESTDEDSDGVSDESDLCPSTQAEAPVNQDGCSDSQLDSDMDGIMNDVDLCEDTPQNDQPDSVGCGLSQKDTDSDGVSDAIDSCPDTASDASVNALGCSEEQLTEDDDEDGVPNQIDECTNTPVGADVDSTGCELQDSDGDGYFDNNDAFPEDSSQWIDSDGDGYGDNASGFKPDSCLDVFGRSTVDVFGCPDLDQDGTSDTNDVFPSNPTQISDFDGDGYGDNLTGTNGDAFPEDPTQQLDTDGDGYGDNVTGSNGDACPLTPGTSINDRLGCLDSDSDGVSDLNDNCPNTSFESLSIQIGMDGCVPQTEGDGDECADGDCETESKGISEQVSSFAEENPEMTVLLGIIPTMAGAVWTLTLRKGKGRKAKKFLRLARAADDMAEVARIRGKIDDLLADGVMDGHVHQNITKLLDERQLYLSEHMKNIAPEINKIQQP